MSAPVHSTSLSNKIFPLYIIGFLFALHTALPAYINSTFLSLFSGEQWVGILYTISSIVAIASFVFIPAFLERFGNYRTIFLFFIIEAVSLLGLAFGNSLSIVGPSFIFSFVSLSLIRFNIYIFFEEFSPTKVTGKIRGFFLAVSNAAWVFAPLLGSLILSDSNYYRIYFAALALLVPIMGLTTKTLKKFSDPHYHKTPYFRAIFSILKNKNILDIFMISFLLQFFFTWMVIYTPLYLHEHIGFSWMEIGGMFSIMLLPFAVLELPLGKLADTKFGEKEILSIGFVIMALSTSLITFIDTKNLLIWTFILLSTRIGAAMVEVMSETYFFKK